MGSNATGKGTRLMAYINTLGDDYTEITYEWMKKGKLTVINSGRLYSNGIFFGGRTNKDGTNWVGTDGLCGSLGDMISGSNFFNWLKDTHNPHTVITEGYFGICTQVMNTHRRLNKEDGGELIISELCPFDEVYTYIFLYDTLEDFVERTESRSGSTWKSRGKDPETSRGWGRNLTWQRAMKSGAMYERTTSVKPLCPLKTPVNYFIGELSHHQSL